MHWKSGHKSECHKLTAADSPIVNNENVIGDITVSEIGKDYVVIIINHYKE